MINFIKSYWDFFARLIVGIWGQSYPGFEDIVINLDSFNKHLTTNF